MVNWLILKTDEKIYKAFALSHIPMALYFCRPPSSKNLKGSEASHARKMNTNIPKIKFTVVNSKYNDYKYELNSLLSQWSIVVVNYKYNEEAKASITTMNELLLWWKKA